MGEILEALRRLQDVELQLAAIRRKREAKTRRVAAHQRQAKQADERLEAHRRKTRERQIKLDNLSLEVSSREQSINKHREALNKAKTNKEYGAILAAMNTEKADTAKLESSVLQLMDEIHELQNEAAEIEAERAKLLENVSAAQKALEVFEDELRARNAIADRYDRLLGDIIDIPIRPQKATSAWAQYTILVDDRDQIRECLQLQGIPTMVYYPRPLHVQPAFSRFGEGTGSMPVSERLCHRVLSLPIHPYLDDGTVDRIAGALRDAVG